MMRRRDPSIGIDIGARTLKGIQLRKKGKEVLVDDYFFCDLAVDRNAEPLPEEPVELLNAILDVHGWNKSRLSTLISDKEVQIFDLNLPVIPENEIEAIIRNEVENKFNLKADNTTLDYITLPKDDGTAAGMPIRVFCTKKDMVVSRWQRFKKSGASADVIISEALANVEMLRFNGYFDVAGYHMTVDWGETHVTAALVCDGQLVTANTGFLGVGSVNEALVKKFELAYLEAEQIKIKHNFLDEAQAAPTMSSCIDDAYSELLMDVHKNLDYFKLQTKGRQIQSIILTGGGCTKAGLVEIFIEHFKIPTERANPLRKIQIYDGKDDNGIKLAEVACHMGAAIGLALRGVA